MNSNNLGNFSGKITDKTIAPVTWSITASMLSFVDCPGALSNRAGEYASLAYTTCTAGKIQRRVVFGDAVRSRGKRLFSVDSIRAFLASKWGCRSEHNTSHATQKRAPAGVRDLMPAPIGKTRSTAEGGSKKGRFYKLLAKEFRRGGFHYRQIAREGNAAIYEQAWLGSAEPSPSYEVVRIRHREGFQIGSRFVRAAEVYPNSEAWGVDGFTFTNRNKAWDKFFEMSLEEPAKKGREVSKIEKIIQIIRR